MDLKAFMVPDLGKRENVKYAASPDFKGEDGKPLEWEIRALTSEEIDALRRSCTKRVPVPGKKAAFLPEVDATALNLAIAVEATVCPNLKDAALQDYYQVKGADRLLNKLLYDPALRDDYLAKVLEVCGYQRDFQELVDEAKN